MTDKQQTAVQWLLSKIFYMDNDFHAELLKSNELQQAFGMEWIQILYAYKHGQNNGYMYMDGTANIIRAEQYFTDTYQTEP